MLKKFSQSDSNQGCESKNTSSLLPTKKKIKKKWCTSIKENAMKFQITWPEEWANQDIEFYGVIEQWERALDCLVKILNTWETIFM